MMWALESGILLCLWYRDLESPQVGQYSESHHEWRSAQNVDVWGMVVSLHPNGWTNIFTQITIEGEDMAVWYFSRSHSVKSESFDFTQVFMLGSLCAPRSRMIGDRIQGNLSLYSYLSSSRPNRRWDLILLSTTLMSRARPVMSTNSLQRTLARHCILERQKRSLTPILHASVGGRCLYGGWSKSPARMVWNRKATKKLFWRMCKHSWGLLTFIGISFRITPKSLFPLWEGNKF